MLLYPPFFKYIRYNMIVCMALGSSNVFWVRYFRTILNLSNSSILYIACATTAVLAAILFLGGALIDRAGNKPALTLSGILFALHFAIWGSVAGGIIPFGWSIVFIQLCVSGLAGALWNLANVRMVMGIVPQMGRPHFLALYTVASNLTVAIIPLLWGPVMDYTRRWHVSWGFWEWNSYSMFYLTLSFIMCIGLFSLRSVAEPATMTWNVFMRELLVNTPSRAVSRLITRLRGPGVG
jgi:MFS family permease